MEYKRFGERYVIRFDKGEEVIVKLKELCEKEKITAGSIVGLGAASHVSVGLFDLEEKKYYKESFDFPMEITSFVGNISTKDGETYLHCHINVCDNKFNTHGGHLNECVISATGEFVLTRIEGTVERQFSEEIGLNLFKFV